MATKHGYLWSQAEAVCFLETLYNLVQTRATSADEILIVDAVSLFQIQVEMINCFLDNTAIKTIHTDCVAFNDQRRYTYMVKHWKILGG